MTPPDTREKLLELAEWHSQFFQAQTMHVYEQHTDFHAKAAALLRQVAETMKKENSVS